MALKVLLVDDEKDFLEAMSFRMTTRGMVVVTTSSAQEAINKARENDFDAIVVDYQLPGMDGLNLLKQIKQGRPDARVILLTGYATHEKRKEAMGMGAVDLFEKPLDIAALTQKIKSFKSEK